MIRIGVIREGKVPPDERVPLTPNQCVSIVQEHPDISLKVQESAVRRIQDEEYVAAGVDMAATVEDQEVLVGVKEVKIDDLIPNKTYLFFSHTIKLQEYNKPLLQAVLNNNVRLIDWECLTDASGRRLIGFGRYAGIVGTYNAFRTYGLKHKTFDLKKATDCVDRKELQSELMKIKIPPLRILLTGRGKVAKGAMELLDELGIEKVGKRDFISNDGERPVYCQITFKDYFKHKSESEFQTSDFYEHPENYESQFMKYGAHADLLITGHYWDSNAPFLFTRDDVRRPDFNIELVADISCDIDGPVASTIRPSTIADPHYGYDPKTEKEVAFDGAGAVTVMAVDNLPCELPRDASFDFGEMFIHHVLPSFLNGDKHGILDRATIAQDGKITDHYSYLREWVNS